MSELFQTRGEGKRNVVVTGGSGMAGSAVVRALSRFGGFNIKVISRSNQLLGFNNRLFEIKPFDLLEPNGSKNPFEGAEAAVLCAAETVGAGGGNQHNFDQFLVNARIDLNSLSLAAKAGVEKIVYVGTASSYQDHAGYISEDELAWEKSPNISHFGVGWSKRVAEQFCNLLEKEKGIEFAILRLANIYGPLAKFDPEKSNFIPALVRKAVDKLDPFPVWGSADIKRDILYVDDFASAVISCLCKSELGHTVLNIGSGKVISVGEVVDFVLKAAGHNPKKIEYQHALKSPLLFRGLDCKKAEKELGWVSTTSVEIGVKKITEWWIENREIWTR
ncbi:MAG: NAD(P)-dependent oxidoreductase [Paracoccaceae bacterium]